MRKPDDDAVLIAIRDALSTNVRAEMLFSMVRRSLGDVGLAESAGKKDRQWLFRRQAPRSKDVIPWPLLSLSRGAPGRLPVTGLSADAPPIVEPRPREGGPPNLHRLGPGSLAIHDGPHSITVTYAEDGRWKEASRSGPPDTLAGAIPALARGNAAPPEILADFALSLPISRHGPARVRMPVRLPGGPSNVWTLGRSVLRAALFDGTVPADALCVVCDGYAGTALAWGGTPEEALAAWRPKVAALLPGSPEASEPPTRVEDVEPVAPDQEEAPEVLPGEGSVVRFGGTLRGGPPSDTRRPRPTAANTPAVIVPLEALPRSPPPLRAGAAGGPSSWVRLLGKQGTTVLAALRWEPEGLTLLGDRAAAALPADALDALDATLDDLDRERRVLEKRLGVPSARPPEQPPPKTATTFYRLLDPVTGKPDAPEIACALKGARFDPRTLDAENVRWGAMRHRVL